MLRGMRRAISWSSDHPFLSALVATGATALATKGLKWGAGKAARGFRKLSNFIKTRKNKRRKMSQPTSPQKLPTQPSSQSLSTEKLPFSNSSVNIVEPLPFTNEQTLTVEQPLVTEQPKVVEQPETVIEQPVAVAKNDTCVISLDRMVPVKRSDGSVSVYRCLDCNTFVSPNKQHTCQECMERQKKFAESKNKPHPISSSSKKRKRKVDKTLFKSFRELEKREKASKAAATSINKKAESLIKKYKTRSSNPKIPKQISSFLDFVIKKLH